MPNKPEDYKLIRAWGVLHNLHENYITEGQLHAADSQMLLSVVYYYCDEDEWVYLEDFENGIKDELLKIAEDMNARKEGMA